MSGMSRGSLVPIPRVEDHPAELQSEIMELAPQWQGKGIGSGILRWLLGQAQQAGKPLTLARPGAALALLPEGNEA
jgi:GNAT superfamily N-acetyltransferase